MPQKTPVGVVTIRVLPYLTSQCQLLSVDGQTVLGGLLEGEESEVEKEAEGEGESGKGKENR